MAAELPRPGVEVIQEFRTVSPSVVTPTLVPCVVGACKQIVEVLDGQSLNTDAKIMLAPFFTAKDAALSGSRYVYTGLNGKKLYLSINNSPGVEIEFTADYLTPAAVVQAINLALNDAGVFGAIAETAPETVSGVLIEKTWTLRTIAAGELQTVEVLTATDSDVWSVLGLKPGWVFAGLDSYVNDWMVVPPTSFPNPRNNLAELAVDVDTIRFFLASSPTNVRELQRKKAFCRRGSTVYAYDDGNGDALTPFVDVPTENFSSTATAAHVDGTAILTTALPALEGLTLTLQNSKREQTYTIVDTTLFPLATTANLLTQLNAFFEDFVFTAPGDLLVITSKDKGQDSLVQVVGGTAIEELGLTASHVGTVNLTTLTYPNNFHTPDKTIIIGGTTYTFAAALDPGDPAELLTMLGTAFGAGYTFTQQAVTNKLVITKVGTGSLVIGAGTINSALGLTAGTYTRPAQTNGTAFPVQAGDELFIDGKTFGAINQVAPGSITTRLRLTKQVAMTTAATVTGTVDLVGLSYPTAFHSPDKVISIDGTSYTFATGVPTSEATLLTLLATQFPGFTFTATAVGAIHYLTITKISSGPFTIDSGTANAVLGLTAATYAPVLGANFYITANNLTGASTRPTPELQINSGTPTLAASLLRDTAGVPLSPATMSVYMMYKALRLDVSPATAKPGLLKFDTTTDLLNTLAPISPDNPLALGLYFALINAPGAQVTGLGIDEIAADLPDGTVEAFTRAAEFLEGVEVYAVAPLTHDKTVAEIYNAHVSTMSAPANKGERVVLFNTVTPTHQLDTLVTSGTAGNSTGSNSFDTGVANLSSLLLAAGVPNPVGTIDAKYGVYLDVASDSKKYSVQAINGSIITVRLVFTGGENDDGFYAQSPDLFPPSGVPLIDEVFAIKVRGAELTLPTGKPDKSGIALTVQEYAQSFLNRRFWHIIPDKCAATLQGVEQQIEGYYMCAAYAGLVAGQPPQQSFTNFPVTGFTRVMGSNDTYSEKQLNIMAAGGNWIVVQDTLQSPLTARMALTTDMTSVETRTDSITKVVDFTAKIMRRGFRNFIGRFNITQGFMDSLGHVGQGILTFLTESGVLIGGSLNNIIQDEAAPDTVLIDATLDPPYPCNYIRLTLVI